MAKTTITRYHCIDYENIPFSHNFYLCNLQGEIFKEIAEQGYNIEDFYYKYASSWFCEEQFDGNWSAWNNTDFIECCEEILSEIDVKKSNDIYDSDFSFWLGFMLKCLGIETGLSTKKLVNHIPYSYFARGYFAFTSGSIDDAIEEICNDFQLILLPDTTVHEIEIPDELSCEI